MNSSVSELFGTLKSKMPHHSTIGRGDAMDHEIKIPCLETTKYRLKEEIAKGGFSVVYAVQRDGSMLRGVGRQYAAKVFDLSPKIDEGATRTRSIYLPEVAAALKRIQEKKLARSGRRKVGPARERGKGSESCTEETKSTVARDDVVEEIRVLKYLQGDKHIIKLYDFFEVKNMSGHNVWIVTERLDISLRFLINSLTSPGASAKGKKRGISKQNRIPFDTTVCIVSEILKALQYLKSKRVVHRDLKPGNILISSKGKIKLCDFGGAVRIPDGSDTAIVEQVMGTRRYMASELSTEGYEFDCSADIWALGVILYNLFEGGEFPMTGHDFLQGFHDTLWVQWAKSNESYFAEFFGPAFLSSEELEIVQQHNVYRSSRPLSRSEIKEAELALEKYNRIKVVADVVKRAMVPQPKNGPNNNIQREGMCDRISIEEFMQWAESKIGSIPQGQRTERIKSSAEAALSTKARINPTVLDPIVDL